MYEYLAKTYLEPAKKKKSTRKKQKILLLILSGASLALFLTVAVTVVSIARKKSITSPYLNREFSLVLIPGPIKINYDFKVAGKIEVFDFELNDLNASRFNFLEFNIKKLDYNNKISVKIEFVNSLKEKSEIYISDIPSRWKKVSLPLERFNKITDWRSLQNLMFAIEEWNASQKEGVIYIDDVKLIKA